MTTKDPRLYALAPACLALLAEGLLLLAPVDLLPVRAVCAFLLMILPGYLLAVALQAPRQPGLVETALLCAGFSYPVALLSGLTIFYVGGRLAQGPVMASYLLVILALAAFNLWRLRDTAMPPIEWKPLLPLAAIMAFAAYFRLWGLGYADLLGDEAVVLSHVVAAVNGEPDALFRHFRMPGETMFAGTFCILTGRLDELTARLPFALAGTLLIAALYQVGRDIFNERVGLAAAALAALNGFFVSHSRMVSFPAFSLLTSTLYLWAIHRFYTGSRRWLMAAAVFAAMGLLTHYEIVLLLPGGLYLLWKKWPTMWAERRAYLPALLASALVAVLLAAYFFVPYALSPGLTQTAGHAEDMVGKGFPYDNLARLLAQTQYYSTTYYTILVAVLFIAALPGPLRSVGRRRAVYAFCAAAIVAVLLALYSGFDRLNWTLAVSVAVSTLLITSERATAAYKAALIWFAGPFFFYVFFAQRPGSHYYLVFVAGTLLAGLGLVGVYDLLRQWPQSEGVRRAVTAGVSACLLALYLLSACGSYLLFTRCDLEYQVNYPRNAHPLYWVDADYTSVFSRFGGDLIGFPVRSGWQMVGSLYRTGALQGDWQGNDRGQRVDWYTLNRPENGSCYPRYSFMTEISLRPRSVSDTILEKDYSLFARVWDGERLKMSIYTLGPDSVAQEDVLDLQEPPTYDTYTTWESFDYSPDYPNNADFNLGGKARLLGYEVDNRQVRPGGRVVVTLYWQMIEAMDRDYKVFVHVEGGQVWGQHDTGPRCGTRPTTEWEPGQVVVDRHLFALAPETPPGEHPLNVGLYDEQSGQRLEVLDGQGSAQGDFITLGKVTVR